MHHNPATLPAPVPLRAVGDVSLQAAQRALQRVTAGRSRRVVMLLAGVWLINIFDLTLTLLASADGVLHEENPIARALLHNPAALLAFKLSLVAAATTVLFNFRRFRCAEIACTLALFIYAGVAIQWRLCYEMYDLAHTANVSQVDVARIDNLARMVPTL
ncbi:MAG TPA: DUF5658 family protein [Phycisphaerae bacterium]|nr:hypothetical protein [Phycisphaerales bacterium]HRX87622.1 DUF5658 family protein [Phycisphaerae bacterium]